MDYDALHAHDSVSLDEDAAASLLAVMVDQPLGQPPQQQHRQGVVEEMTRTMEEPPQYDNHHHHQQQQQQQQQQHGPANTDIVYHADGKHDTNLDGSGHNNYNGSHNIEETNLHHGEPRLPQSHQEQMLEDRTTKQSYNDDEETGHGITNLLEPIPFEPVVAQHPPRPDPPNAVEKTNPTLFLQDNTGHNQNSTSLSGSEPSPNNRGTIPGTDDTVRTCQNETIHQSNSNQHTNKISRSQASIPESPREKDDDTGIIDNNTIDNNPADSESRVTIVPTPNDVLSGRGASVNAHAGNKRFRALCFTRKPEFDAANLAAKKRITAEIVDHMVSNYGTVFLKQSRDGWQRLSTLQAMHKAAQVMRDFRRPDRVQRARACRKRNRATATPLTGVPEANTIVPPIIELPAGVHVHDVLSGRGAFCNEHAGNQQWRAMAMQRRDQFHAGTYAEKRALAAEIINAIHSLDPPGRFLQKRTDSDHDHSSNDDSPEWVELSDDKAIQKTCQVMRDMERPDRRERDEKRRLKKLLRKEGGRETKQTDQARNRSIVVANESGTISTPLLAVANARSNADDVPDRTSPLAPMAIDPMSQSNSPSNRPLNNRVYPETLHLQEHH